MTREEIIKQYEMAVEGGELIAPFMGEDEKELYEMLKAGLSALRPITREQVEMVWGGEWEEERFAGEHEPVLCIVSGKPKANITLEEAYQLGSWNKADGWIIDEYLDWEDADVSWWRKLPEPPGRRPPEGEEEI